MATAKKTKKTTSAKKKAAPKPKKSVKKPVAKKTTKKTAPKTTKKQAKKSVKTKPAKQKTKKTTKIPAKVVKYLDKAGIDHEILEHKTVYTAIDAANTMGKKMEEIAKSLVVKADKDYYLVLIPADHNIDFEKLNKCLSKQKGKEIKTLKIPGEKIMENALKIKTGALTAFGKLHKLPVVVDKKLTKAKKAVFSSGSLNHSIEIATDKFIEMEEAVLGVFGKKKKIKK